MRKINASCGAWRYLQTKLYIHTLKIKHKRTKLQPLSQDLRAGRILKDSGYTDNELKIQDGCLHKGTRGILQTVFTTLLDELHSNRIGTVKMNLSVLI